MWISSIGNLTFWNLPETGLLSPTKFFSSDRIHRKSVKKRRRYHVEEAAEN